MKFVYLSALVRIIIFFSKFECLGCQYNKLFEKLREVLLNELNRELIRPIKKKDSDT